MERYKVISADSHAHDGADIYKNIPSEYKHQLAKIEKRNGGSYLIQPGQNPVRTDLTGPLLTEEDLRKEFRGGTLRPNAVASDLAFTVQDRLADLDEDGVYAEIIYNNSIFRTFKNPDPGYQQAAAKLCNDYYIDLFRGHSDRLVPAAIVPLADLSFALEEVERVAKMGYRAMCVPTTTFKLPYDRPDYEPFWSAVEEVGVPLSFHTQVKDENEFPLDLGEEDSHGTDMWYLAVAIKDAMNPLVQMIASGVPQRHPNLKIVLVESGIGWVAWFLNLMDELYQKRHMWHYHKLELLPSEYFKRQCYATFGDDEVGLRNLDITGVDSLLWGSDYPHDEGTFPHSRDVIERTFKDVPEDDARKILGENAAKLYDIPLD